MPQKIWNPTDYDKQCILQFNTAMVMLDTLSLEGHEVVLDVGCGTGKTTEQIAKARVPRGKVLGVDINQQMISFAQNHYQRQNLTFECCDVLEMKYKARFHVAVSFWTLSWIALKDQLRAITNMIESLKDNGKLFVMYPLKHDAYDVVSEVIKKPKWLKYFNNYTMPRAFITEAQYRLILSRIPQDLMNLSVTKKEIECRYKDDAEMISSINCWLAHVDEIPCEKEKLEFLTDVANSYKTYRRIEHPIMYYSTLEITGTKMAYQYQPSILCKL